MSHLGLGLLYAILNREDHIRRAAYAPALTWRRTSPAPPLTSLESGTLEPL
jgi:hypothetical protein